MWCSTAAGLCNSLAFHGLTLLLDKVALSAAANKQTTSTPRQRTACPAALLPLLRICVLLWCAARWDPTKAMCVEPTCRPMPTPPLFTPTLQARQDMQAAERGSAGHVRCQLLLTCLHACVVARM